MATARLYYGSGLSAVDAKGRVAIPNQLRALIVGYGGAQIGLMPSGERDCLSAFDMGYLEQLPELLERAYHERSPGEPGLTRELLASQVYPNIETVPFDASGRFILSPLTRMLGQLDDLAFFHGSGSVIDIWKPALALDEPTIAKKTKIALEYQLKQRGAK